MAMLRVTGLWEGTTRNGEWQLSGSLGGVRVIVMRAKEVRSDKAPTHVMLFADSEKKQEGGSGGVDDAPF